MALHPNDPGAGVGAIFGSVMSAIAVGLIAIGVHCDAMSNIRKKCVENGAAHYDSKTGEFTWKNEVQ